MLKEKTNRILFDAYIGQYPNFWDYLDTYKNAFDILLKHVNETGGRIDRIAFPMLFAARHVLELGFKANIRYFAKYSHRNDYTNAGTHDLAKLFQAFKLHINETIKNLQEEYAIEVVEDDIKSYKEYINEVEKLTSVFDILDKRSDSFRYPVDKENNKQFDPDLIINLLDVHDLLEKSTVLLVYTTDVFQKYFDYSAEIESIYEQEMKSEYYGYY